MEFDPKKIEDLIKETKSDSSTQDSYASERLGVPEGSFATGQEIAEDIRTPKETSVPEAVLRGVESGLGVDEVLAGKAAELGYKSGLVPKGTSYITPELRTRLEERGMAQPEEIANITPSEDIYKKAKEEQKARTQQAMSEHLGASLLGIGAGGAAVETAGGLAAQGLGKLGIAEKAGEKLPKLMEYYNKLKGKIGAEKLASIKKEVQKLDEAGKVAEAALLRKTQTLPAVVQSAKSGALIGGYYGGLQGPGEGITESAKDAATSALVMGGLSGGARLGGEILANKARTPGSIPEIAATYFGLGERGKPIDAYGFQREAIGAGKELQSEVQSNVNRLKDMVEKGEQKTRELGTTADITKNLSELEKTLASPQTFSEKELIKPYQEKAAVYLGQNPEIPLDPSKISVDELDRLIGSVKGMAQDRTKVPDATIRKKLNQISKGLQEQKDAIVNPNIGEDAAKIRELQRQLILTKQKAGITSGKGIDKITGAEEQAQHLADVLTTPSDKIFSRRVNVINNQAKFYELQGQPEKAAALRKQAKDLIDMKRIQKLTKSGEGEVASSTVSPKAAVLGPLTGLLGGLSHTAGQASKAISPVTNLISKGNVPALQTGIAAGVAKNPITGAITQAISGTSEKEKTPVYLDMNETNPDVYTNEASSQIEDPKFAPFKETLQKIVEAKSADEKAKYKRALMQQPTYRALVGYPEPTEQKSTENKTYGR